MSQPSPDLPSSSPAAVTISASGARQWKAGTLVYSGAGLFVLFCWLLWGDFAWQMKERAAVPVAQLMLRQLEASDFIVGLLVGSIPAAIGFIITPVISVASDRHRGRRGRRIPYLLIPTPFIALGMAGMAFTPQLGAWLHGSLGENAPSLIVSRLIVFSFFWGIFEIFSTIANAVFGGLINDVVPAAWIGRFFGLFRAVSLMAGIVFNYWLIGHAEEHFTAIFIGLGLLYGIGFALMCLNVREGDYAPPPVTPPARLRERIFGPVKSYARECFANPFYLWAFAAITFGGQAQGPVNAFSVYYAKSLGMPMKDYGILIVITYSVSLVLSFLLGWLADKFHPLRLGMIAVGLYAVVLLTGGFIATDTRSFSIIFVAHGILNGIFITGTASLAQRLFPQEKFAQFASAAGLAGAVVHMVFPPAVGYLLDSSGHVYRYTFIISGAMSLFGLVCFIEVYRRFRLLGGVAGYRPPGSS